MRSRTVSLLVIGCLMAAMPIPHAAAVVPPYWPDVFVKNDVGEGVHDPAGVGETKAVKAHRGDTLTLPFWNRNDGNNADTFSYLGCSSKAAFRVTWRDHSGADVTGAVTAGTFTTAQLEPGWSEGMLKLSLKVKLAAIVGDRMKCTVLATSGGDGTKDKAGYKITVVA
jgi:hypothetical protein